MHHYVEPPQAEQVRLQTSLILHFMLQSAGSLLEVVSRNTNNSFLVKQVLQMAVVHFDLLPQTHLNSRRQESFNSVIITLLFLSSQGSF